MDMLPYLQKMVDAGASDLFFSVGAPVSMKVTGQVQALDDKKMIPGSVRLLVDQLMTPVQQEQFENLLEQNLALSVPGLGRFRVNVFLQRGEVGMVVRAIKGKIPQLEMLGLPEILQPLALEKRGLILLVGGTGVGKSTTMAAMVDYRNRQTCGHILTVEDPIEYFHHHKSSIVNQREVGFDTKSYANALKSALREAPDMILIGEIRDRDTMEQALNFAQTGHLCVSTLHATNANQAIERIVTLFPDEAQRQIRMDLSLNLKAIISQRLVPGTTDHVILACEVMLNTPYISDLINKGEIGEMKKVMAKNRNQGMQTFDQALYELITAGKISVENALMFADSKHDLKLQLRLDNTEPEFEAGLALRNDQHKGEFPI